MNTFFENNRKRLGHFLEEGDLAILLNGSAPKSTADAHYSFLCNKNFYYFSGCTQEKFIIAMHKIDGALKATLFIEKADYDVEKWVGRKLTKEQAIGLSGIEDIQYLETFYTFVNRLVNSGKLSRLFLDLEKLDWSERDSEAALYAHEFSKRYPFIPIKTLHQLMIGLRTIKQPFEIEQIQKAVDITEQGLKAIMTFLKPDVYEYQLEATFSHAIRMMGADGNSFPTIAASGADAVILHYVENNKPVVDGDLVLLDLGAQYHQYAADISRTFPVNGKFTERQKTLYNIVLEAQEAVIKAIKPGTAFESLNKICQEILTKRLIEIGLMKDADELGKYYYHGVSHHLGLDVHDLGPRACDLAPGMVITVEPGLYIAEEGIGIRIEEDVLVTDQGHDVLSKHIPKTVEDIERFMNRVTSC